MPWVLLLLASLLQSLTMKSSLGAHVVSSVIFILWLQIFLQFFWFFLVIASACSWFFNWDLLFLSQDLLNFLRAFCLQIIPILGFFILLKVFFIFHFLPHWNNFLFNLILVYGIALLGLGVVYHLIEVISWCFLQMLNSPVLPDL